jgi:hypothetical protein
MTEDRLQDAFQYVRKTFFPRWDRKKQWKVEYRPEFKKGTEQNIRNHIKRMGLKARYPDKINISAIRREDIQRIWFYEIPKDDNVLHLHLIHEICHVKTSGHGKKWAENMTKAYQKALANTGMSKNLAIFINHDIHRHFMRGALMTEDREKDKERMDEKIMRKI